MPFMRAQRIDRTVVDAVNVPEAKQEPSDAESAGRRAHEDLLSSLSVVRC
jgi:hypothetical protein